MKKIEDNLIKLEKAQTIFSILEKHNYEAYIVGGAVRDYLLNLPLDDIDFTTNARPENIKEIFEKTNPIGERFGTIQVLLGNESYEITTYRKETEYNDNRHPDKLIFSDSLEEDIIRRDFTINALALDKESNLIDLVDGLKDIKEKTIRTVGNPDERFKEDGLRKWRAVRFASQKGFSISSETKASITKSPDTSSISFERIREELTKILLSKNSYIGGQLLLETGLYPKLLERLFHRTFDKDKLLEAFNIVSLVKNNLSLRLAALVLPFNEEEAEHFLKSLKYSKNTIKKVLNYKKYLDLTIAGGEKNYKKGASILGRDNLLNLSYLQEAIAIFNNDEKLKKDIEYTRKYIEKIIQEFHPLVRSELKINGNDLMKMGYMGKEIKTVLDILLLVVYSNPSLNNPDSLKTILKTNEVKNAINITK